MNTLIDELFNTRNINDYLNTDLRKEMPSKISHAVNELIPKIPISHDPVDEKHLKENGYVIFKNFFSENQCSEIRELLVKQPGYNAHVPIYSDGVPRVLSPNYEFNTLSYPSSCLFDIPMILEKVADPSLVSLAQSYLDCFPTLYSLNSWWHIYKDQTYGTQKNHRDHDDFRFLALFIYLTDVDETNGPHVFYPKTQDGSESNDSISIIGKAGTAILADTFATHRGQPLQQGSRLVCWWRYGLSINAMHYHDGNDKFKRANEKIFAHVPNTDHNNYLFRAFIS